MILASDSDYTLYILSVQSGPSKSSTRHVTLKGHTGGVTGAAFLGDESHVITGSLDSSLRVWRTADGVQTAKYDCHEMVCHRSY